MLEGRKIAALCTSRIYDPQHFMFIEELSGRLRASGIHLMIFALNSDLYWVEDKYFPEAEIFSVVPMNLVDVLIIMDEKIKCHSVARSLVRRAGRRNVPVIVIDGKYEGTSSVNFDYSGGFEEVVRHMIEFHGAKKPHFMAGLENNTFSDERIAIFKKVIAENGIEFKPSMLSYGDFWAAPAIKAMKKVLDSGDIPDAVICANDIMAINVAEVIKDYGYSIPDDIIVSGFDGYDEANFCTPKITTASCGCDDLADALHYSILKCIESGDSGDILVKPVCLLNGSCGCNSGTEVSFAALNRFNNGFYRFQDDIRILYEITTAIQSSETIEEASSKILHEKIHDIHCFVHTACFDTEKNYLHNPVLKSEKYKYSLFYSSYKPGSVMKELDKELINSILLQLLSAEMPLIFNELDYLGKPLGFVCYSFKDFDNIEYAKTASITNMLSMGLGGFINARYQKYLTDKVAHTYRRDQLTGLYNRTGFGNALDDIQKLKENFGSTLTVIMADLDGLKYINDNFGHEAGDTAIKEAAHALKECCPEGSLCVRFGGDEMLAFILSPCDPDEIIGSIDRKLGSLGYDFPVAMSCGAFVTSLNSEIDLSNVIKQADEKMYYNKRQRKEALSQTQQ